jgi:hypothetical protein
LRALEVRVESPRGTGGWQVAGIQRYQSGLAYVVHSIDGGTRNFLDTLGYYGNIRPNLTGQPLVTGAVRVIQLRARFIF